MDYLIRTIELKTPTDLHMRPAAEIAKIASEFESDITVRKGSKRTNAGSIFELMMLGIKHGETFDLAANGPEAVTALNALQLYLDTFSDEKSLDILPQRKRSATAAQHEFLLPISSP